MSGFNLRKRARVCYYEPEEPPFDEFIFCTECRDYVYEYCAIHGPLLVIPDDKVPARTGLPAWVPRAALTIPKVFLHLARSNIPEAGLGVFSTLTLPRGVRFGPYRGRRVQDPGDSCYSWQIYDRDHKPLHVVDARDAHASNWMRYVNCSRHHAEQNLVAYQYQGQLYYRTVKVVPRFTELLVFYGSEFAASLGVQLRAYRKPCPCLRCQALLLKKTEQAKNKKRQARVEDKKEKPSNGKIDQTEKVKATESTKTNKIQAPVEDFNETTTNENINEAQAAKKKESTRKKRVRLEDNKQKPIDETTDKKINVAKFQGPSKSSQDKILKNSDIQKVSHEEPAIGTTTTNAGNFKCNDCGKGFHIKPDLEKHINTHIAAKDTSKYFTCKTCSCTFNTKLLLLEHEKSQHGVKYFTCNVCGYATKNKGDLRKHERCHSGEKPFKCSYCNAAFSAQSSLKCHQRIHTNEKPYKCSYCNATFRQQSSLIYHQRTHTGDKPFECNVCEYKATTSGALKRHLMSRHSGQKPYGCDTCGYRGATRGHLTKHMKTHRKPA